MSGNGPSRKNASPVLNPLLPPEAAAAAASRRIPGTTNLRRPRLVASGFKQRPLEFLYGLNAYSSQNPEAIPQSDHSLLAVCTGAGGPDGRAAGKLPNPSTLCDRWPNRMGFRARVQAALVLYLLVTALSPLFAFAGYSSTGDPSGPELPVLLVLLLLLLLFCAYVLY